MNTEYDFIQLININQLLDEINTVGIAAPISICTSGNSVQIFYTNVLSTNDANTLNTVVANHVANPSYIPLATQTQVTTLLSYLNNSNTIIANTARAVIVSNLAPNLPIGLMTNINNQILAIVGH